MDAPRLLLLLQGATPESHPGVVDAVDRLLADGTLAAADVLPWKRPELGDGFWGLADEAVRRLDPDLLLLHHFHAAERVVTDPRPFLERLRRTRPELTVAVSVGDAFADGLGHRVRLPRRLREAATLADVAFASTGGEMLSALASLGPAASLLPLGACQVRFPHDPSPRPAVEHQVVVIGSRNQPRNPLRGYYWGGRRRRRMLEALDAHLGDDLALFGHGWEGLGAWRGPVPFEQQHDVLRRARVVVAPPPFSRGWYYLSNRPMNTMTSRASYVEWRLPGIDHLFRDGEHLFLVEDDEDLARVVDELLAMDEAEREGLARGAAEHVMRHHTQEMRLRSQVATLQRWRDPDERHRGPDLSFVLPEAPAEAVRRHAVANWP